MFELIGRAVIASVVIDVTKDVYSLGKRKYLERKQNKSKDNEPVHERMD